MRIKIIILYIIIPCNLIVAQTEDELKNYSIGLNYSIDYTFRTLKTTDAENSKLLKDYRDNSEEPSINYTIGLGLNYSFSNKTSLQISFLFAQTGYQTKENAFVFGDLEDPRRGYTINMNNLPIKEKVIVRYHYLNIPIKLRRSFVRNKYKFFIEGGISMNYYLRRRVDYTLFYQNGEEESFSENGGGGNLYKVNMAFVIGCGLDYYLKNRYFIRINPMYTRSFIKIADWVNKEYFYSAGINLGLYYTF